MIEINSPLRVVGVLFTLLASAGVCGVAGCASKSSVTQESCPSFELVSHETAAGEQVIDAFFRNSTAQELAICVGIEYGGSATPALYYIGNETAMLFWGLAVPPPVVFEGSVPGIVIENVASGKQCSLRYVFKQPCEERPIYFSLLMRNEMLFIDDVEPVTRKVKRVIGVVATFDSPLLKNLDNHEIRTRSTPIPIPNLGSEDMARSVVYSLLGTRDITAATTRPAPNDPRFVSILSLQKFQYSKPIELRAPIILERSRSIRLQK